MRTFPTIQAQGPPFELGRQHGQAAGELITRFARIGLPAFLRCTPAQLVPTFAPRLAAYAAAIGREAPHLLEEIRGIAVGAGITPEESLLLQLRPELGYARRQAPAGCTSIGVAPARTIRGAALLGQNVDMPRDLLEYGIVLHLRPQSGPEILTWTLAGVIGQTGINSWGVGRCGNVLFSGGWRPGLTTTVLFRLALEARTAAGVVDLCARPDRAKSNNFLVSDATGTVATIEMTTDDHRVLDPGADGVIVHANHYQHPDFVPADLCPYPDASRLREKRMLDLAHRAPGPLADGDLQEFLSDHANDPHSICGHGPPGLQTIASCVLEASRGRLWVSHGNPCESGYALHTLDAARRCT